MLDFGVVTGHPVLDKLLLAMNENVEQIQGGIIREQDRSHRAALREYVQKGEHAYLTAHAAGETVDPATIEAARKSREAVLATSIALDGRQVHATSETDKAVIEMAKAQGLEEFAVAERQALDLR